MNFNGIIVGLATFLIIGICHPIVIKAEYHFGKGCWRAFLANFQKTGKPTSSDRPQKIRDNN